MRTESPEILGNSRIQMAAMANDSRTLMRAQIVDALTSTKTWDDMNKKERKLCVDHLISESESETDLRRRLSELGVGCVAVKWSDVDPNDKTALEAQMLVKALGGPTAKNGALVMVNTMDDFD